MLRLQTSLEQRATTDKEVSRMREFIISSARLDGHGTVIPLSAWDIEDFEKMGIFYYMHQTGSNGWQEPNPDYALGPATAFREGSYLIGQGTFEPAEINPLAEKIMGKIDHGTLRSASVGFRSLMSHWGDENKGEDPTVRYFDKVKLYEYSIVNIPSNPDAMKRFYEPMDNYLLEAVKTHPSKGFQKDFAYNLRRMQLDYNKHSLI